MLDRPVVPDEPWNVHTYDNSYRGSMSITRGTLSSDNTIYAQLTLDVGPRYVWQMAHRLGIHLSPDKPVASIGLGSLAVSPLDMAAAYSTFPAMGIYAKPMAITKVILPGGHVDKDSGWGKPQTKRAVSRGGRMEGERRPGQNALYGTGAGSGDGIHLNAGKTGHDREPRRRLVRRLHAPAHHGGLDGLPEGRDPDDERARPDGRRRDLPGSDLARVHGGRALAPQGARLRVAGQVPGVSLVHPWQLRQPRLVYTPQYDPQYTAPATTTYAPIVPRAPTRH